MLAVMAGRRGEFVKDTALVLSGKRLVAIPCCCQQLLFRRSAYASRQVIASRCFGSILLMRCTAKVVDAEHQGFHHGLRSSRHSSPGMIRSMNSLNIGTVKAVSPWLGLQIIPLPINWLRVGASELTRRPSASAMSPER